MSKSRQREQGIGVPCCSFTASFIAVEKLIKSSTDLKKQSGKSKLHKRGKDINKSGVQHKFF